MFNFCGFIRSMKLFLMVDGYKTYICTSAWSVSSVYSTTIGRARYWESQVSGEPCRYRESQVSGEPGITSGSRWLDIYLEGFGHAVIFLIPCVLNVYDWSWPQNYLTAKFSWPTVTLVPHLFQRKGTPPPHFFSTRTLMREGRKPVVTLKPVRDVCVLMLHPLLLRVAKGLDDAIWLVVKEGPVNKAHVSRSQCVH